MLAIPEIHPDLPETHIVLTEDDVISQTEAAWFRRQLKRIAGKNRFGKSNLRMVWGPTHEDEMEIDRPIKYQDFTDGLGRVFGERRFFIEIWRSPEFLRRSSRYKVINDPDVVVEFYFCKACDAQIECDKQALEMMGSVPACPRCGSTRSRTELIREAGKGQFLCEFPNQGCYDYWLRLERADLTYHPPDNEILEIAKALWKFEQLPQNQRDALEQADREIERRMMIAAQRQNGTIYTGAVHPLMIPTL